jgi:hypothetical protein
MWHSPVWEATGIPLIPRATQIDLSQSRLQHLISPGCTLSTAHIAALLTGFASVMLYTFALTRGLDM